MLPYFSLVATTIVAIFTLYSGYFKSGAYLLARVGSIAIAYLIPSSLWHAQVVLWWFSPMALGMAILGPLGAIGGIALAACTLMGWIYGTSALWALLCLYGALFGAHVWRLVHIQRTVDDTILLLCLVGGSAAILSGIWWGWDVTRFCNLVCQIMIGLVLRYRPELIES